MPERIDHAGGAMTHIKYVHEWQAEAGDMEETQLANAFIAQAEATLALVEQQRIANLIALTKFAFEKYGVYAPTGANLPALFLPPETDQGNMRLHPDIAAALGIKQEGESHD